MKSSHFKLLLLMTAFGIVVGCDGVNNVETNQSDRTNPSNIESESYRKLGLDDKLLPGYFELPSSRKIKIINISQFTFPKSGPALVMHYETSIRIENLTELRKEADEIWQVFRRDAEKANVTGAAIRAVHNETRDGITPAQIQTTIIPRPPIPLPTPPPPPKKPEELAN